MGFNVNDTASRHPRQYVSCVYRPCLIPMLEELSHCVSRNAADTVSQLEVGEVEPPTSNATRHVTIT